MGTRINAAARLVAASIEDLKQVIKLLCKALGRGKVANKSIQWSGPLWNAELRNEGELYFELHFRSSDLDIYNFGFYATDLNDFLKQLKGSLKINRHSIAKQIKAGGPEGLTSIAALFDKFPL
jgi:hypothetical protein